MKRKMRKYMIALLFIGGLLNVNKLYACDTDDWTVDDWVDYFETENIYVEYNTTVDDFKTCASTEDLETVYESVQQMGITDNDPDAIKEILEVIIDKDPEYESISNQAVEYDEVHTLDFYRDCNCYKGTTTYEIKEGEKDDNHNGIDDNTEDLNHNGINDFKEDRDGDGIPDVEDPSPDCPWWSNCDDGSTNTGADIIIPDEGDDDNNNNTPPKDPTPPVTCQGIQCPICGGYLSTSSLRSTNADPSCKACSCSQCVQTQTRVNDLFNHFESEDYLKYLTAAAKGGAPQFSILMKNITGSGYLDTPPVAGGLPAALANDGSQTKNAGSNIAAAYNEPGGSNIAFSNQQMLDLMNAQATAVDFQTVYLIGDHATYALVVTDLTDASKYTGKLDTNGNFKPGTRQLKDYNKANRVLTSQGSTPQEADAMAKAYMYQQSKMGVSLFEEARDTAGNLLLDANGMPFFNQIILNVNKDGNGQITSISKTKCQ